MEKIEKEKCKYFIQCNEFFGPCDKNDCNIVSLLKKGKIPPFLTFTPSKTDNKTICTCPRSNKEIYIKGICINTKCPYYNPKVSTHCLHLHSEIFNKDILGLVSTTLKIDKRYLDYGIKLSTYIIRFYIIILLYLYHTNSEDINKLSSDNIKMLSIYKEIISKSDKDWLFEKHTNVQEKFNDFWVETITTKKLNKNINDIGYKKLYSEYDKYNFKLKLLRLLISEIEINGINILNIPLLFIVRTYYSLFGYIDIANFGISDKKGNKMTKIFLKY